MTVMQLMQSRMHEYCTWIHRLCIILQAVESAKAGSTYASLAAAPANYNAIHTVEVERYLSAALFGLASSAVGRDAIASAEAEVVRGKPERCHSLLAIYWKGCWWHQLAHDKQYAIAYGLQCRGLAVDRTN